MNYESKKITDLVPDGIKKLGAKFFVAGGAITSTVLGTEINDLDIYAKDKLSTLKLLKFMDEKSNLMSVTDKSVLGNHSGTNINIVYLDTYPTAEHIFQSFDFTIVMAAWDSETETITHHPDYLYDVAKRRIVFNPKTKFPLVSLLRVQKYEARGFKISRAEFIKIAVEVTKLNIASWKDCDEHIGGMYGELFETRFKDTPFSLDVLYDFFSKEKESHTLRSNLDISKRIVDFVANIRVTITQTIGKIAKLNGLYYQLDPKDNVWKEIFMDLEEDFLPKGFMDTIANSKIEPTDKIELFKWVKPESEVQACSFYKSSFKYVLNSKVVSESSHSLFFGSLASINRVTYSDEKARVLLRTLVEAKDYIRYNGDKIEVKSCVPTDIIVDYKPFLINLRNNRKPFTLNIE